MEEKTVGECIEYIYNFLIENKIKKEMIKINDDTINFNHKGIEYFILVEAYDCVQYGVNSIDDVDLDNDFWQDKVDCEDYKYIDTFLFYVINEKQYDYVKQIWKSLEKLQDKYDEYDEDFKNIIAQFFGMMQ